jgi:hypothetical protein
MISPKLCIRCKGKLLCGLGSCQILNKHGVQSRVVANISGNEFVGSSPPSLFVGWNNYPKVQIAPLSPTEVMDSALLDAPEDWFGLPQEEIISFREQLLRSNTRVDVNDAANPGNSLAGFQELVMATRPTAIGVKLKKRPVPSISFHESIAPHGPSGELVSMRLEENPGIPQKIDYAVSDTDLKSQDAIMALYNDGFNVSRLYKLLSAGTLGIGKNRKLVPTRWAISAVDSNISKELVEEKVKGFQQAGELQLFHSNYLDNDYWVLLVPASWSFEQLECWLPGGTWAVNAKEAHIIQDHEFYAGRKTYASNVEGAYYSARLAVAEHLVEKKRQAAAIVFREIGSDYQIPLGVWQIRENVRNALRQKPLVFSSLLLALAFLSRKLRVPIKNYRKESRLLDFLQNQKRLSDFAK